MSSTANSFLKMIYTLLIMALLFMMLTGIFELYIMANILTIVSKTSKIKKLSSSLLNTLIILKIIPLKV